MNVVYIFGNGNISFDVFQSYYIPKINNCLNDNYTFIMGDFRGADTLTMEYLKDKTNNVQILYCYEQPRYLPDKFKTNVEKWKIIGDFKSDKERDNYAINLCSHFIAIDFNSDNNRISGTTKNIKKLLELNKTQIY